jgi:hypothetical protein
LLSGLFSGFLVVVVLATQVCRNKINSVPPHPPAAPFPPTLSLCYWGLDIVLPQIWPKLGSIGECLPWIDSSLGRIWDGICLTPPIGSDLQRHPLRLLFTAGFGHGACFLSKMVPLLVPTRLRRLPMGSGSKVLHLPPVMTPTKPIGRQCACPTSASPTRFQLTHCAVSTLVYVGYFSDTRIKSASTQILL